MYSCASYPVQAHYALFSWHIYIFIHIKPKPFFVSMQAFFKHAVLVGNHPPWWFSVFRFWDCWCQSNSAECQMSHERAYWMASQEMELLRGTHRLRNEELLMDLVEDRASSHEGFKKPEEPCFWALGKLLLVILNFGLDLTDLAADELECEL